MTKKVTKKNKPRGRRLATALAPKFDAKKHIKLTDLAKECKISYQSMYLKQKRTNIKAVKTNLDDLEVIAFTKEDANKIRELAAQPMRKDSVALKDIEDELRISRPKLMNALYKLRIFAVKRQGTDNRQTLTVSKNEYSKIKEALNS